MRHQITGNRLGRNSSLRKATVRDIAKATLIRQRICTTKAKAKEARKLVDRLITLGKKVALAHKRRAYAILNNHKLVSQLFNETAPRFNRRQGGYTRIIPLSQRRGDNAELAFLELTEKTEVIVSPPRTAATDKGKKPGVDASKIKAKPAKKETKEPSAKPSVKVKEKTPPKSKQPGIKKFFRRKSGE